MTIEEMREKKRELGYSYEQISELSGLPLGTVQKVLGGITKSPRYDTLAALERVFRPGQPELIGEPTAEYNVSRAPGMHTVEDYYSLPDERRAELIDGVFYDMCSPTHIHQLIGGQLYRRFADYIDRNQGGCIAAYAPLDVQLDCDEHTMVQPDVLIVCDREKFRRGIIYGAPDLIVEILSKSTRRKDSYLKLMKYAQAGVREYWMVDPERKKIVVYDLEHEEYPSLYGFEDTIPVRIYDGACQVNFAEINDYISFLYDKI